MAVIRTHLISFLNFTLLFALLNSTMGFHSFLVSTTQWVRECYRAVGVGLWAYWGFVCFSLWAGISLVIEGFMSGFYHICPSNSNFQFGMNHLEWHPLE